MRVAGIVGLVLLAGCTSEFTFTDSVNSRLFEIKPRSDFGDELSVPYVLGAEFSVFVEDNEQETDFVGWRIESTNPRVLSFRDEPYRMGLHTLGVDVAAAGEGVADLLLRDENGEVRGSAAVEVKRPNRAKLFAAPIYALDNPDFRGETPRPRLLVGGVASFAVEFLRDDLRLQGSTALRAKGSRGLEAAVEGSELAHNRNWLRVAASALGRHEVELWVGEALVERIDVEAVGPGAIAGLELIDGDADTPDELAGEWLVVAQAVSEDKEPIYGVDFEWELPGRAFEVPGDIFVYEHDVEGSFQRLTARAYGVSSTLAVRAAAGEPASSDAALACDMRAGQGAGLWALVALGLRRRRGERRGRR